MTWERDMLRRMYEFAYIRIVSICIVIGYLMNLYVLHRLYPSIMPLRYAKGYLMQSFPSTFTVQPPSSVAPTP